MPPRKGTKRSRKDEEEEEVSSEDEEQDNYISEEEESGDDDNDQDFKQATTTTKKKKSTTTKTPKKKSSAKNTRLKTGKKSKTTTSKSSTKTTSTTTETHPIVSKEVENSLFSQVRNNASGGAMSPIINDWIHSYQQNNSKALSELITFFLHSCGCMTEISAEEISKTSSLDEKTLIEHFVNTSDYPIISTHKQLKDFASGFSEFWQTLIKHSKDSILFDGVFLDFIKDKLTEFSNSNIRPFRHSSTLALYEMIDAKITVLTDLTEVRDTTTKQLNAAKKSKNTAQQKTLATELDTQKKNIDTVLDSIKEVFESVFGNRYRDTVPEIRALSMQFLGKWIQSYSDLFLSDNYLKYLGWKLNDRTVGVRESAIKALIQIYKHKDWQNQLKKFTQKFLPRMFEMTLDINIGVACDAIQLLTILVEKDFISSASEEKEQMDQVYSLVFDEHAAIRYYAAKFIYSHVTRKPSSKKKKTKNKDNFNMGYLIDFMNEYHEQVPMAPVYIVDSFWTFSDIFYQWSEIVELLTGEQSEELEETDILHLLRLLVASIKKLNNELTFGSSSVNEHHVKIPQPSKKKKISEEEQKELLKQMTVELAPVIPQLIAKYQTEEEKLVELLEIPKYFVLSAYTENHMQHQLDELLKLVKDLFWKHTEVSIFRKIAQVFFYLLQQQYDIREKSENMYNQIVKQLISKLRTATESNDDFTLKTSLIRVEEFVSLMDLKSNELFDDMLKLLQAKVTDQIDMSKECYSSIIHIAVKCILWKYHSLKQSNTDAASSQQIENSSAAQARDKLKRVLQSLMESSLEDTTNEDSIHLIQQSFYALCDMTTLGMQCTEEESKLFEKAFLSLMKHFGKEQDSNPQHEREQVLLIASLSKAILFGSLSEKLSNSILIHYALYGKAVADGVKHFHTYLKQVHGEDAWEFEYDALKSMFEHEDTNMSQFVELGNRLAQSHFPGRDQKQIAVIVRTSIQYYLDNTSERYDFFKGLIKYVRKLDPTDARDILNTWEKEVKPQKEKEIQSTLDDFRDELKSVAEGTKKTTAAAKKSKKKSSKEEHEEEEEHEEQAEEEEEQGGKPQQEKQTQEPEQQEEPEVQIRFRKPKRGRRVIETEEDKEENVLSDEEPNSKKSRK